MKRVCSSGGASDRVSHHEWRVVQIALVTREVRTGAGSVGSLWKLIGSVTSAWDLAGAELVGDPHPQRRNLPLM